VTHSQYASEVTHAIRAISGKLKTLKIAMAAAAFLTLTVWSARTAVALPCPPHVYPCVGSPIIIDTDGKGFHLTSADDGVRFDITGDGKIDQIAWTARGSTNAFLALPHDGKITSGQELFGNFTPQPLSNHPNGFLALAVYDLPGNGGNGDGVIDDQDAVFSSLRLWIDKNHDGVAQPDELYTLPELGVFSISLHYKESWHVDKYGNLFRYKGSINFVPGEEEDDSKADKVIYDVFFRIADVY
jgi:hypothetical protein